MIGDPDSQLQFTLPPNVVDFRPIPLWGIHDAKEARSDLSLADIQQQRRQTTEAVVESEFIPLFRLFLYTLLADAGTTARPAKSKATASHLVMSNDLDSLFWVGNGDFRLEGLAHVVHQMYRFFLNHDFDTTMRSRAVWQCFVHMAQDLFPSLAASCGYRRAGFSMADLASGMNWLYHWLFPLAAPLPRVDVTNAAMAGICTLVAVAEKLEYGAGYLLTEHGVYLRERYLAEAVESKSLFLKLLNLRFALRMAQLSYAMADQISPCCDYNQRWEKRNGADTGKLQTIYYGVDAAKFIPEKRNTDGPPVVVWVGRIDPLKDLLTLLEAAAVVHRHRPDIRFLFYGSAPPGNEAYYRQCLDLRTELGLDDTVVFAGYTPNTASAFNAGDVSVLSSISEGFPYAILEAMMCERPVIATAVGGIPEQVEGCGIAVEPRNPQELAQGILTLINDPDLRTVLGRAAREKAAQFYSTGRAHGTYYASYRRLAGLETAWPDLTIGDRQRSLDEEGQSPAVSLADPQPGNGHGARSMSATSLKLQVKPASERTLMLPDQDAITELAIEIARRDSMPVDSLEVAALIESLGITDAVAQQRYGVADVFDLGKVVLTQMRASALTGHIRPQRPDRPQTFGDALRDYIRGPMAVAPSLIMLLIIFTFASVGHMDSTRILALSLGMTGGMLLASGFVHSIGRRGSIYLGMEKLESAWRFVWVTAMVGIMCGVIAALLAFIVGAQLALPGHLPLIFALSLAATTTLWLLGVGLSLRQQSQWLAIALFVGLLSGVSVYQLVGPGVPLHLALATVVGFTVSVVIVWSALLRAYDRPLPRMRRLPTAKLPSAGYLIQEAAPYFAYGLLGMIFILIPHVLGWAGTIGSDHPRLWAGVSIEVGMTLALAPFMLAGGVAERSLRLFWRRLHLIQRSVSGSNPERFAAELWQHYREYLVRYLVVLGLASLADYAVVQMAVQSGLLAQWLQLNDLDRLVFIFQTSLLAYWLFGWGMFNCIYSMTLAQARLSVQAIGMAIMVLIVIGVPLSLAIDFSLAGFAFAAGGVAFVVISSWSVRRVLQSADYYLFASL